MLFKLDNAEGDLVDLTPFSPDGFVSVPIDQNGLMGGGSFSITFKSAETISRHLTEVYNLDTGQSQTYEYQRGTTLIAGECFLRELRFPSNGVISATFIQTGPQTVIEASRQ